ncbi:SDR family oxidoreductase [Gilvimarinus sp. F26214L]|uniref:SDR family oxidoreductase n=1 Tax=Gilvimarinus sp. DZF01 TaxID=3461371 RepID=UPI00404635C3
MSEYDKDIPPQHQERQPGKEGEMEPRPIYDDPDVKGCGRLEGKVALITGGDSGIGRATAVAFAKEGANVFITYLEEHEDAAETQRAVRGYGKECEPLAGDVGDSKFCHQSVKACLERFGQLDVLVNNAGEQHIRDSLDDITPQALERVFKTNIFSMFYMVQAAVPYMQHGGSIINTTSITAYKGNPALLDYSTTKGAIVSFTRSLSMRLLADGIRVNAVAPGPIWTPLIPASFPAEQVENFGQSKPIDRPGQPVEVAPCYVFLASRDSSYISGQVLHPNGGAIVNG